MASPAEPGYCAVCGKFALLTPAGACVNSPSCIQRLKPPEPYAGPHVCNTGDRLKPGHPEYRRCSCGQWYHSAGGYWYRVDRPPVRWLRSHGLALAGEFLSFEDEPERESLFGEFVTGHDRLRYWWQVLRAILH